MKTDAELRADLMERLDAIPAIGGSDIEVLVDNGMVTLSGQVDTQQTKFQVERTARRVMGLRGRDWMARDFGWDAIGRDMVDVYRWMTGTGEHPSCVRID